MTNTLSEINKAITENAAGFIKKCEDEYKREINEIAKRIADNDDIKIVAIAGPSGSGKTTTAHILRKRLEELGENTDVISLDDFYLPFGKIPLLPDGNRDIESVYALDIPCIEKVFKSIIKTGSATLPKFDFVTKTSIKNAARVDIGERGIVIVEGLHALNPAITGLVKKENILKIYISVNMPIENEGGEQLLSSRQIRLARRVLRDERFRGASAQETLFLWNKVVEGESKYLYCFKNTADIKLTTLHSFEPCVYREPFCRMRSSVGSSTPCYEYFIKTANVLEQFCTIDSKLIPEDSLIREFIGNE
ncbi:MAG: hypothetical protein J5852_00545 [Clostridia bacterium]|nr:hypothetical protein [Clostridia bacterium]